MQIRSVDVLFLACLVLLASLVGCMGKAGVAPVPTDSVVGSEIRQRLQQDPVLGSTGVRVSVFEGKVILSGVVPSKEAVDHALDVAGSVKGVQSVTNNLEVQRAAP